jgi:uncharacterized protein (DUF1501 family)
MLSRRQLLTRALKGSTLLALSPMVPQFLVNTAHAADPGRDHILVVIEMTGGNDGLNTVIPYANDLYHKYRPTLRFTKEQVVRVNDEIGLHPNMRSFERLLQSGQLAVVQGVGYPNPDRSHFESMDKWQSGDPRGKTQSGWLGRSVGNLEAAREGGVPAMHIGRDRMPLALQGATGGAVSVNERQPFKIDFGGGNAERLQARRTLVQDLAKTDSSPNNDLLDFVARRQVQTLTAADRLQDVLTGFRGDQNFAFDRSGRPIFNTLAGKLALIGELIQRGFGTRVFYVTIEGFDTHSNQAMTHGGLLGQVSDGITNMFERLKPSGHDKRVRVMTFSEFGRRVEENGSKGTDHGAGSCLFVAGSGLSANAIGNHPSLKDLDAGDLKYHTDFRRVYATLLDHWLGIDSQAVLGGKFEHLDGLKKS